MTSAEGLVLVSATFLVLGVMVGGGRGTLPPRTGVLLLTLALLAVFVALLHVEARGMAVW